METPKVVQGESDLNWTPAQIRDLAGRALDLWMEMLSRLNSLPVSPAKTPAEIAARLALAVPENPLSEPALTQHLRELMFECSTHAGHPRFLAYVSGSGTAPAAIADMLAAALNPNVSGWRMSPGPTFIELRLIRWFADCFGLPPRAGGLVVPGGAIANLTALKVARDSRIASVRTNGVGSRRLTLYASEDSHVSIDRAVDILGLGTGVVRHVRTDSCRRMKPELLESLLERDLRAGFEPFAIVGTAGTTGCGAIDPLPALASIAERYAVWFHVDAAYGGAATLSPKLAPLLGGIDRADSITFDPHKWMYIPQSASCALFRDAASAEQAFTSDASYCWDGSPTGVDLGDFGPQWSRGFDAFKIWLSLLVHGSTAYRRRIEHDVELIRWFADCVRARAEFELLLEPVLSICCFRYLPRNGGTLSRDRVNRFNERLLMAVQRDGRAYISNAVIDGVFALRVCIVNHRTEAEDLESLLDLVVELAGRIDDDGLEEGTA